MKEHKKIMEKAFKGIDLNVNSQSGKAKTVYIDDLVDAMKRLLKKTKS